MDGLVIMAKIANTVGKKLLTKYVRENPAKRCGPRIAQGKRRGRPELCSVAVKFDPITLITKFLSGRIAKKSRNHINFFFVFVRIVSIFWLLIITLARRRCSVPLTRLYPSFEVQIDYQTHLKYYCLPI